MRFGFATGVAILLLSSSLQTDAQTLSPSEIGTVRLPLRRNENGQLAAVKRLSKRASGQSIYNAIGREYLIEVGIGTPAQMFNLTLDTGSAELWVPSVECPASTCPYSRYNPKQSSTYKASPDTFSIEYGLGSANGTYALESVTTGGITITNQKIGLAKATENILGIVSSGEQSNGIMGFGYPGLNAARGSRDVTPFVFNLVNGLSDPVFSIFLNSYYAFGMTGEILFGGIDKAKYVGNLAYAPVVRYDLSGYYVAPNVGSSAGQQEGTLLYWTVAGQGVEVTDKKANSTTYKSDMAALKAFILDTGTTLTMIPKNYADHVVAAAAGAGNYTWDSLNGVYFVNCKIVKQNKTVDFLISSWTEAASSSPIKISAPVSELVIPLDTNSADTATQCAFAITISESSFISGETWILGEATLRSVYQVYDMKNNRIGLAQANFSGANQTDVVSSNAAPSAQPSEKITMNGNDHASLPPVSSAIALQPLGQSMVLAVFVVIVTIGFL
ncbi:aspartic peptidase domain-containing protein [Dichotomocladium elegans]|nr:aspartic peptidase domain-containing protein [Dichotomocladium elegans]